MAWDYPITGNRFEKLRDELTSLLDLNDKKAQESF